MGNRETEKNREEWRNGRRRRMEEEEEERKKSEADRVGLSSCK